MNSSFQWRPPEIPPGLRELIDQQAKWQKDLARHLTAAIESARAFQQTLDAFAKLQPPIELWSELVLKELQPTIQLVSERFAKQLLDLGRQLAEKLKEQAQTERKALALLAPRGWLISPSISASATRIILETIEEIGIDETERQLIDTFDPDFLEAAIARCRDRPTFVAWEQKLDMAVEAHRRGEYALAIPIWLIVIEGILTEELSTDFHKQKEFLRSSSPHQIMQVINPSLIFAHPRKFNAFGVHSITWLIASGEL